MKATWETTVRNLVNRGIIPTEFHRVLLYGPPGTGKTALAHRLFPKVEDITLFPNQFQESLFGTVGLTNGNTTFQPGPLVRAFSQGLPLVINEFHDFSPDTRTLLHSALDDRSQARLTLPSGETITPGKGYCVIATTNENPAQLPPALLDRFDLILCADTPVQGIVESVPPQLREIVFGWYKTSEFPKFTPEHISARTGLRMAKILPYFADNPEEGLELILGSSSAASSCVAAMKTGGE